MKLQEQKNQEIVIGSAKEMMFSIDDSNPIIFEILRNKMYSNKIGAIAREVASNSRDANREAGTNEPVEIEFTNSSWLAAIGDTAIIFRDFGLGISPQRMSDIFLKYAASTKRDTNEQTGGFGLGAKTPFAYTDSFIVSTVSEGVKYVYNAIIDTTGKGKMVLMSEDPTDQRSGTEIIIPILSNSDRYTFEKEVYRATGYWDNIKYINFTSEKPKKDVVVEGKSFKILKNFYTSESSFEGLLDGIPYEVRPSIEGISGYTVLLNLDLDKLTINANRESLQYDEQTVAHVNQKAKDFIEELNSIIRDHLDNGNLTFKDAFTKKKRMTILGLAQTNFEAFLYRMFANRIYQKQIDYSVYFNGEKVTQFPSLKFHTIARVKQVTDSKFKYDYSSSIDIDSKVIYHDKGRINVDKNASLGDFIIVKPDRSKDKTEEVVKEKAYIESLGFEMQNYSDVKVIITVGREKKEKTNFVTLYAREGVDWVNKVELIYDKETGKLKDIDPLTTAFTLIDDLKRVKLINNSLFKLTAYEKNIKSHYYIRRDVWEKYLKDKGYKLFSNISKNLNLQKYQKYAEADKIKEALSEIPEIIKEHVPEILPASYRRLMAENEVPVPNALKNIFWGSVGVKPSKFDYYGLEKKFHKVMELNYPMLLPYINSVRGNKNKETTIRNIKNYVKISNCSK